MRPGYVPFRAECEARKKHAVAESADLPTGGADRRGLGRALPSFAAFYEEALVCRLAQRQRVQNDDCRASKVHFSETLIPIK